MTKTLLAATAVGTLAAALIFPSCSGKKADTAETVIITPAATVLPDAPGAPVKENVVADTMMTLGSVAEKYTLVERIYEADDSSNFYMSVSVMVPAGKSPVATTVSKEIDRVYASLEGPVAEASEVNSPGTLAKHIDALGDAFVAYTIPMAESTDVYATPGYMMSVTARPVYAGDGFVTYDYMTDYYIGGNSADYSEASVSYNPATGQVYTLEDLVVGDSIQSVRQQLVETMAKSEGKSVEDYLAGLTAFLGEETPLTVATFPVYNVAKMPSGLVFTYPKYAIAPGSEGSPRYNVTIADGDAALKQLK